MRLAIVLAGAAACIAGAATAQPVAQAVPPPPTRRAAAAADQIPAPGPSRRDLSTGQVAPTGRAASASAAAQLSAPGPRADAPPALSAATQGRNTRVVPVSGRDRCDPAAADHNADVDCAAIADRRPEDFANPGQDRSAVAADPNSRPADLVDAIVGGGTGTVIQTPRP